MLELQEMSAGYRATAVVSGVSLRFVPGRILVLAGPNGCGKSTLLRTALGLQPRLGGRILLDGVELSALSPRQIAQRAAFMAQSRSVPNITAGRLVLHGRFPYLSYPRRYQKRDRETARRALEWVGGAGLADRPLTELSGGQRQKIYLAMALAQDTETILMDEPTTFLDVRHQLEVMALARKLAEEGRAVGIVLHDLCLALRYADRIALLHGGGLLDYGPPEALYERGLLEKAFGVSLGRVRTEDGVQYYYRPLSGRGIISEDKVRK
ncbi:MAG: ABC transporter ATP-binding protein [Oscillibacter sp.]|nr:ABC transporter ATP-binding protein [Oscillibacter sp.]